MQTLVENLKNDDKCMHRFQHSCLRIVPRAPPRPRGKYGKAWRWNLHPSRGLLQAAGESCELRRVPGSFVAGVDLLRALPPQIWRSGREQEVNPSIEGEANREILSCSLFTSINLERELFSPESVRYILSGKI